MTAHGHHQTVNTVISLMVLFAAKYGGALLSQQKQNLDLTVAQIISSLLKNTGLKQSRENHQAFHV